MAVGGPVKEINFNHPTLGSATIFTKSGEGSTFNLGGYTTADDQNNIDSSGQMIQVMSLGLGSCEVTAAWDDNIREDLEKMAAYAASTELCDITITKHSGAVYGGKGKPVGDLAGAGDTATFPLKLALQDFKKQG